MERRERRVENVDNQDNPEILYKPPYPPKIG